MITFLRSFETRHLPLAKAVKNLAIELIYSMVDRIVQSGVKITQD